MKFFKYLFTAYFGIIFISLFLILFPFIYLSLQSKKTEKWAHYITQHLWGRLTLVFCGIRVQKIYEDKSVMRSQGVFCSNHTSYLDIIASFYLIPGYFSIVGKSSLGKIPLFGYFYSKLYILVDRADRRSKFMSMKACNKVLQEGRSLVIYPEGTIPDNNMPYMIEFKPGPFRIAIENQVPIIPFTFVNNWKILPDDGRYGGRWMPMKVVFHKPISTIGLTLDDIEWLKKETFQVIQNTLNKYNNNENKLKIGARNSTLSKA